MQASVPSAFSIQMTIGGHDCKKQMHPVIITIVAARGASLRNQGGLKSLNLRDNDLSGEIRRGWAASPT